jgi:AGCS family alanine or glycine:cation symporter
MSIDAWINDKISGFADKVESTVFYPVRHCSEGGISFGYPEGFCSGGTEIVAPLILIWLVLASVYFTFYLGFVNVRYFKHSIDILRGKFDKKDADGGQINRFQALATSLSGTVGLGNIAGVAIAVSIGGPGAVLWMIIMGFFGMSLKFAEVTFGVKYRHHPDASDRSVVYGGPMYYLRDAFANRNIPIIGSVLAAVFALCCILGSIGGGNLFQANQAYQQVLNVTTGDLNVFLAGKAWLFGVVLAALVGAVIIGGIKSIAKFTSKLVPIMGGIYMIAGLIVIGLHYDQIGSSLRDIVSMAFSMEAGIGGLLGVMLQGVKRAAFSNEAGLGSAAIVHATAQTDKPVSQGFVGMLGPFIDTIVICTVTGLVIVITGAYKGGDGMAGVELTSKAFAEGISWFPYVLALTVFLFAFSTLITWSYYGQKAAAYLFGENKFVEFAYKLLFLVIVVVGCTMDLGKVVALSEAFLFIMGIPNVIGLYFLSRELKRDVKDYQYYLADIKPSLVDK